MKAQFLFAFFLFGLLPIAASAGECPYCGGCEKVCKLVWSTKPVEVTCYGYKCEDVCIPGPSERGQTYCESVGKCDLLCLLRWTKWLPRSAKIYHRRKLTKYVVKREVPSYKWVVVPACQCGPTAACGSIKPAPTHAEFGDEIRLTDEELLQASTMIRRKDASRRRTDRQYSVGW